MANFPYADHPVLLVDDEPQILLSTGVLLRTVGVKRVHTLEDSRKVLSFLADHEVSVIVVDLSMPFLRGEELLTQLAEEHPHVPVLVMTANSELETAVRCMRIGAFDYLVKPVDRDRFLTSVMRAMELNGLRMEILNLRESLLTNQLRHQDAFARILTNSQGMRSIFQYVEAIAPTNQPVLITGETGVGKELFAEAVHQVSGRGGRFVAVNVAGLDDNMFSDTLFGHRKGAFTGAAEVREGLIAQAAGGTLFLDEIGDLPGTSQVKLLRLLQENKYYPLGADVPQQSDARVVVATHQDLRARMDEGLFRKDLYYRLRAHQVHIPPLRERYEDLPALVDHFLDEAAQELDKRKPSIPAELITLLQTYHFPGNVRELKAMVFDAVTRHGSGMLSLESFTEVIHEHPQPSAQQVGSSRVTGLEALLGGRFPTLKEAEQILVDEALRRSQGNQGIAAGLLGISRQALNKRLVRARSERN
jgi:DNA-binding NtrC family response regulator